MPTPWDDEATGRRWLASLVDGLDALTPDQARDAVRLALAANDTQNDLTGAKWPDDYLQAMEARKRALHCWEEFKGRHGLTSRSPLDKRTAEP